MRGEALHALLLRTRTDPGDVRCRRAASAPLRPSTYTLCSSLRVGSSISWSRHPASRTPTAVATLRWNRQPPRTGRSTTDRLVQEPVRRPGRHQTLAQPLSLPVHRLERVHGQIGRDPNGTSHQRISPGDAPQRSGVVVNPGLTVSLSHPDESTQHGLQHSPAGQHLAIGDLGEESTQRALSLATARRCPANRKTPTQHAAVTTLHRSPITVYKLAPVMIQGINDGELAPPRLCHSCFQGHGTLPTSVVSTTFSGVLAEVLAETRTVLFNEPMCCRFKESARLLVLERADVDGQLILRWRWNRLVDRGPRMVIAIEGPRRTPFGISLIAVPGRADPLQPRSIGGLEWSSHHGSSDSGAASRDSADW